MKMGGDQTAREILEAEKRNPGSVPTSLRRWAEDRIVSRIPWQTELSSAIRGALNQVRGNRDFSYARPARREDPTNTVILPAMVRPIPKVAVVVDTSGSMGQQDLEQALAEVRAILTAAGQPVTVLSCDAAVHTSQRVFRANQVTLIGGGGTNMGIGIEAALHLRPRPDVVIVLTDGYTPWPKENPDVRVHTVVALIGDGSAPPWARKIRVQPLIT